MWDLFCLIVSTEAITQLITKADIFLPIRRWLFEKGITNKFFRFIHDLVDCPYCTSVWIALSLVVLLYLNKVAFTFLSLIFITHRFSNLFHFIIDRVDPHRFDLEKVNIDFEEKEE